MDPSPRRQCLPLIALRENWDYSYLVSQKKELLFPGKVNHIFYALSALYLAYKIPKKTKM
jgi:hypothetical protein